jgi:uncharacterized protein YmfQ (DUF2313 family)
MLGLGPNFILDNTLESMAVQNLKDSATTIITEMLPDTTASFIDKWEAQYGLVFDSSLTIEQRRLRVISSMRARGGLSIAYFVSIAESLGYTLETGSSSKWFNILDGIYIPFRSDVSKCGDMIYDSTNGGETFTWQIFGTNIETDTALREVFEKLKPVGTTIEFTSAVITG